MSPEIQFTAEHWIGWVHSSPRFFFDWHEMQFRYNSPHSRPQHSQGVGSPSGFGVSSNSPRGLNSAMMRHHTLGQVHFPVHAQRI